MFRTNITVRTAIIKLQVREVTTVTNASGDYRGTFVQGIADAIHGANDLRGYFNHTEVSCSEIRPDCITVRYHCGSVHHDVFVEEIKKFIPQLKAYVEELVGRPLQWLDFSFDVANGEAQMGYDGLQFEQGYLGMQYQESYMNNAYLNSHEPCNPQLGLHFDYPSHNDTVPNVNPAVL
jgi:hypothetical protein